MTTLHFYRTLWHGALRTTLSVPPGLYLLPFSSWFAASRPGTIKVPELFPGMTCAVDSGAYRYRHGRYPYQPLDYLRWSQALDPAPSWVVMPDWFGQQPDPYTFPRRSWQAEMYGPSPESRATEPLASHILLLADLFAARFHWSRATRVMQLRTSLMAYTLWDRFRDVVACWSPVIQGNSYADYVWHTRMLLPLIKEMQAYYGRSSVFRVGIGALANRAPREIVDIVTAITALLPEGTNLHLFAVKQQAFERFPASLPPSIPVLSVDSSQWNGQRLRGTMPGKKAWQESGLTQLAYGYTIALPVYEDRLQAAWVRVQRLPRLPLPFLEDDPEHQRFFEQFLHYRELTRAMDRHQPERLLSL